MYPRADVKESIFPYDDPTMKFSYRGDDAAIRRLYTQYLGNTYPIPLPDEEEKKNPFSHALRVRDFATTQLRNRGTGTAGFFRRLFGIDSDSARKARLVLQKEMNDIFKNAIDSTLLTEDQIQTMYSTLEKNLEAERGLFGGISTDVAKLQSELMEKKVKAINEHNALREIDEWVQIQKSNRYKDPDMSRVEGYAKTLNSPPETSLKIKLKEKFRDYMVNHSYFSEIMKEITDEITTVKKTHDITNDKLQKQYNKIDDLISILHFQVLMLGKWKSPGADDLLKKIQELNRQNKELLTLMKQDNAPKANKAAAVSAAFFKPAEELGLKRGGRGGSPHDRRQTAESLKTEAPGKAKAEPPSHRLRR